MKLSVQINLAPTDFPYARHILPHQLRQLGPWADEVLLVYDLHRSPGRFGAAWEERKPRMDEVIAEALASSPKVRLAEVDYSESTRREVGERFLGGREVPVKDARGGPFYSYLFALHAARNERVFHLDSDILVGGAPDRWIADAQALLDARPNVLAVAPHPGAPGEVRARFRWGVRRDPALPQALILREFSTRAFLFDRTRLPLVRLRWAPPIWVLRALKNGNPPYREPETLIGREMRAHGLEWVTMLGSPPGAFVIHMGARGDGLAGLAEVVAQVEAGALPEAQRGVQDVHQPLTAWAR